MFLIKTKKRVAALVFLVFFCGEAFPAQAVRLPGRACLAPFVSFSGHELFHAAKRIREETFVDEIRIQAFIEAIAAIGKDPLGGNTRLAFSEAEDQAHNLAEQWMREMGLEVRRDAVGNLYGRITNSRIQDGKVIRIMSHLDSVSQGGRFDGVTGIASGFEVLRQVLASGQTLMQPVELVVYRAEESSRFNMALLGSYIASGNFMRLKMLSKMDKKKVPDFEKAVRAAFERYIRENHITDEALKPRFEDLEGLDADSFQEKKEELIRKGILDEVLVNRNIAAAFEVHPEQAKLLEEKGEWVGLATGMAMPSRHKVEVTLQDLGPVKEAGELFSPESGYQLFRLKLKGSYDHSGATPMNELRQDALAATAELAVQLRKKLRRTDFVHGVDVASGEMNKVPGEAEVVLKLTEKEVNEVRQALDAFMQKRLREGRKPITIDSGSPSKQLYLDTVAQVSEVPFPVFRDAGKILGFLEAVHEVETQARKAFQEGEATVATVGKLGKLSENTFGFLLDVRDVRQDSRDTLRDQLTRRIPGILKRRGMAAVLQPTSHESLPVELGGEIRTTIKEKAGKLRIQVMDIVSGASHDLYNHAVAEVPSVLILLRSIAGKSHCPEEDTPLEDIGKATQMVLRYILDEAGEETKVRIFLSSGNESRETDNKAFFAAV